MSETGNGRKNWTRVVAAVGLVFLAVAGGLVLANANKVIMNIYRIFTGRSRI